ncbi:MAG: redoxin domain-containing protein [Bacteroidaceae bacterium]|nr:redoxin domain-containing protein [Bacteroidaceae bacterium]MBR5763978.1 redoxin domain-containing protein [Bacteroidaceae bacterium]
MKRVRWIFVLLLFTTFISFVGKDHEISGLKVGEIAPDFVISPAGSEKMNLTDLKGHYVLVSFWASYDAKSRLQNVRCSDAVKGLGSEIKMVSVSFDEYSSIFDEVVKKDRLNKNLSFVDTKGTHSPLYRKYYLGRNFHNYLLDKEGRVIACDVAAEQIKTYLD